MEAIKYMRIHRNYWAICMTCAGSGYLTTKNGAARCPYCVNGDVERWLIEIVTDEQEQEGGGA